jgi:hypothetical protein
MAITLVSALDWASVIGIPIGLIASYLIFRFARKFGGIIGEVMLAFSLVALIDMVRPGVRALGVFDLVNTADANAIVNALRLLSLGIIIFAAMRAEKKLLESEKKKPVK